MSSTSVLALVDAFKPHPADARIRLRHSAFGLVALVLLVNLSPVPGPWRALDVVWRRTRAASRQPHIVYDTYGRASHEWVDAPRAPVGTGVWCVCAAGEPKAIATRTRSALLPPHVLSSVADAVFGAQSSH
jgi:hypothetical protein